MVDLSICIVSWNTEQLLMECLQSIVNNVRKITSEIIVVDNASSDNTLDRLSELNGPLKLIANRENRGFAAACNQAIRSSNGRYLLLLNPDTVVHPGTLEGMVAFMESNTRAGAAGCKLLNEDGSIQLSVRHFPSFTVLLIRHTFLTHLLWNFSNEYKVGKMNFEKMVSVDQPAGAALLVRRDVLREVGFLDEQYFMYYEEVDLCCRIKQAGYQIYYLPQLVITHYGGASASQKIDGLMLVSFFSMFRYFNKHRGRFRTVLFRMIFKPLFLFSAGLELWRIAILAIYHQLVGKDTRRCLKRRKQLKTKLSFFRHDLVKFIFSV